MTDHPTQPESPTFIGTEAAQARIARLRARRRAAERVDGIRAEMAEPIVSTPRSSGGTPAANLT